MIDGNEKRICRLSFEYWSPHVIEKRSKCISTEVLSITAMIREVNSAEIALLKIVQRATHAITRPYSAKLQTAKQTITTSKH